MLMMVSRFAGGCYEIGDPVYWNKMLYMWESDIRYLDNEDYSITLLNYMYAMLLLVNEAELS